MTTPSPGAPRTAGRRVVANVASLASASLWRIGVAFVIQVAIARRLGPAALGDYAIVLAWLYVAQICLEAGLPSYTVRQLAGHPERRRAAHHQVLRLQVALSIAAWAALAAIAVLVPALRERLPLLVIAGASLPFYAILSAAGTIFEASERMDRVFFVDAVTNTLLLIATLAVLVAGSGVAATLVVLVAVQICSALLASTVLIRGRFLNADDDHRGQSWRSTLAAARPFFYLSLADVLQQRADLLLLGAFALPQVVGVYAAANALVRVLIKVVQAYWRAIYPTLSRLRDGQLESYRILSDMAQRLLLGAMLPATLIGASVAAGLIDFIYGAGYEQSAAVLAILLFSVPAYLWEVRGVTALLVEHEPRRGPWIALAHLIAMFVLLPPLAIAFGAWGAALAASLAAGCGAVGATIVARGLRAAPPDRRLLWMLLSSSAAAVVSMLLQATGIPWWLAATITSLLYVFSLPLVGALSRGDIRLLASSLAPQGRWFHPT